jgi:hypothetical protein
MSPTLSKEHWSLHGGHVPMDNCTEGFAKNCTGDNVMAQRNYPCDSIIDTYFETDENYWSSIGELPLKRSLYHCMLGQALEMKSDIETRKSQNQIGHILWQLNEIWPTGGWGSLEYGNSNFPGQVVGGRWKPLHYMLRREIFVDVTSTCGITNCYVRNDQPGVTFHGTMSVHSVDIATGVATPVLEKDPVSIVEGPSVMSWHTLTKGASGARGDIVLVVDVFDQKGGLVVQNVLLRAAPKSLLGLPGNSGLTVEVVGPSSEEGKKC